MKPSEDAPLSCFGVLTWLLLHDAMDRSVPQISAVGGVAVVGTLVAGLLFEAWPAPLLRPPGTQRAALFATAAVVAVIAGYGLRSLSLAAETWTRDPAQLWVAVAGLNLIGATIIVHAVLWRRWPVTVAD